MQLKKNAVVLKETWDKLYIVSYIVANVLHCMFFLIELVAQNVAAGMVQTSPATILSGMTDETGIKTVTTCADATMSAVVTVLKIVEARETVLR